MLRLLQTMVALIVSLVCLRYLFPENGVTPNPLVCWVLVCFLLIMAAMPGYLRIQKKKKEEEEQW